MTDPQRRAYKSTRREQQAAHTRSDILATAHRMFRELGWPGTGMREVAEETGVSVVTVYAHFKSKAELLMAVLDVTIVGDADPVALRDRPEFAALTAGSRRKRIAAAAAMTATIHERTAGIYVALRQAAMSDVDLATRLRESEDRRREAVAQTFALVLNRPPSTRERDGVWAVTSLEVFQMLTASAGWTTGEYRDWLADTMDRLTRS